MRFLGLLVDCPTGRSVWYGEESWLMPTASCARSVLGLEAKLVFGGEDSGP